MTRRKRRHASPVVTLLAEECHRDLSRFLETEDPLSIPWKEVCAFGVVVWALWNFRVPDSGRLIGRFLAFRGRWACANGSREYAQYESLRARAEAGDALTREETDELDRLERRYDYCGY